MPLHGHHFKVLFRYFGVTLVSSRNFKISTEEFRRAFHRAANAIFGCIGRVATEAVLRSKCIPILLYGLEACPLRKADLNVLDFVVNRFFIKLFRTNNIGIVKECQSYFSFQLPTEMLKQRTGRFDIKFKRLSASWL